MEIASIFESAIVCGASDIHLQTGLKPLLRINGEIHPIKEAEALTDADLQALQNQLLYTDKQKERLDEQGDCDLAYEYLRGNTHYRFRVNAFRTAGGIAFAMRFIRRNIPTLEQLHMPAVLKCLTEKRHGLIVVTGPTGSGKTTTMSAMLDRINETYPLHILTIEDPIEYIHSSKMAVVNQREIGQDAASFDAGLTAALRQDPDVIFVGEMRDRETVETALNAAETGHLVMTTLHTSSVIEAVDRILQYFQGNQQQQIRMQLANCFEAIIAQKLILRKDGKGRIAALEILTRTAATTNLIRTGRAYQLKDYMRAAEGMQLMEDSLNDLRMKKII